MAAPVRRVMSSAAAVDAHRGHAVYRSPRADHDTPVRPTARASIAGREQAEERA
jgi:hypothetical protein